MKQFLKEYPLGIAGWILGLSGLGNLLSSYGNIYRNILGIIACTLLVLYIAKTIMYPKQVIKDLNNPLVASILPAISMSIVLLSTYLIEYLPTISFIIWITGVTLQIVFIIWFTFKFVFNFNIKQVYPTWNVVYVGIVIVSATEHLHGFTNIGKASFWFGLIAYLLLLCLVFYRILKVERITKSALPTLLVFPGVTGILLVGYINVFEIHYMPIVYLLMIAIISFYIFALIILTTKILKLKFSPSFFGLTFPLAMSATSIKLANDTLIKSSQARYLLKYLVGFQISVAILIQIYVFIRYLHFMVSNKKSVNSND